MSEQKDHINKDPNKSTFRYTNETFSGCDMTASITINTKQKNPTSGNIENIPFTRIVGELTTVSYSIHMEKKPIRSIGNVNAKDYVMGPRTIAGSLVFSVFNKHFAQDLMEKINGLCTAGNSFLVDELPPFDLTISAANEYGYRSRMAIYGIRLLNEGQVMSINDVYTENTYQFFATDLEYLNDEMAYLRNDKTSQYELIDNIATNTPIDNRVIGTNPDWLQSQEDAYQESLNKKCRLLVTVKHPTRLNTPGIVDFILDPPQKEGVISIENQSKEKFYININGERIRKASISLSANNYTASFENTINKAKSNTVAFNINHFILENKLSKYAPIVEYITESSIQIYSNEPSHTKAMIRIHNTSNKKVVDLKSRRCEFNELLMNTSYNIYTYNESDALQSKEITAKTLNSKDKLFDQLLLFCYANSRLLTFVDMKIYLPLIEEAKVIAESKNLNTTDSLLVVKNKYIGLINSLPNGNTITKDEYDLKIKACNEIITMSIKLYNDFISAVNIDTPVDVPTMTLNKGFENVFKFKEDITSAEIYKNNGRTNHFYYEVPSYNFKNIDGKENSFRFNGKPGFKHYIESLRNNARSPKLEFYVMTQTEKNELINKDTGLTDKDQANINNIINKDEINITESSNYKRAFMINAKKINNPILFPPHIETINENVLVSTTINSIVENNYKDNYLLAIASYEDVLCNFPIYKVSFESKDPFIDINNLFYGLKNNIEYAIWIEDKDSNQLSNPSTFVYSKEFDLDEDILKEYEIKDLIENIKEVSKNTLPISIYEEVVSTIENNTTLTNNTVINEVLYIVVNSGTTKDIMCNFLKEFKYYLGIMLSSSNNIINNIKTEIGVCSFDTKIEGTLIIYNITKQQCITYNTTLEPINNINTAAYQDNILLIAINKDFTKKSEIIFINKTEDYLEVL